MSENEEPIEDVFSAAFKASRAYRNTLHERTVMPSKDAIDALRSLQVDLPTEGTDEVAVINELHEIGSQATVATTGGRFFGFVVGGALPVAVASNWLASAWDQNAGSWILSPVAAELESVAGNWMLDLLGLPRDAAFGFVTGATMATFSSIVAARSSLLRRQGYSVKASGLANAPSLRVVMSEDIHPTNIAALGYAGIGMGQVENCPVDSQGRILTDKVPPLDPNTLVILQAGNINSGSFDDFRTICKKAKRAGAWVHVDGAFGLWARASHKKSYLADGIELADSWSVDGHKWLNLTHDSAVYFCRDAEAVHDVFGVSATYLMHDANRQPNNFTPELSRRARGVEFWAALKTLGKSGVAAIVEQSCTHARVFAEGLQQAGYDVLNDVVLNQVVFAAANEQQTKDVLKLIQESGRIWLGPTTWRGQHALRISVSSAATTTSDVQESLSIMQASLATVQSCSQSFRET